MILEDLKEKINNIDKQISHHKEIVKNLYFERDKSVLSCEEDLKKEIKGKIYENEYGFNIVLNAEKVSKDGRLFGKMLYINKEERYFDLFEEIETKSINIFAGTDKTNDLNYIYDKIESKILNGLDYFLLTPKVSYFSCNDVNINGHNYNCILGINENCITTNYSRSSHFLSFGPVYGFSDCNYETYNYLKDHWSEIYKRCVKIEDKDVNRVFYDFYKRSVEFCKNMIKQNIISENQ